MISRRGFLAGLGAALAAPAVIRIPGLLMPIRALFIEPQGFGLAPLKGEGTVILYNHVTYATGYVITDEEMLDFSTDDLVARERRYAASLEDWRQAYGSAVSA